MGWFWEEILRQPLSGVRRMTRGGGRYYFFVDLFDAGEGVGEVVGADEFDGGAGEGFAEGGVGEDFEDGAGDGGGVVWFH